MQYTTSTQMKTASTQPIKKLATTTLQSSQYTQQVVRFLRLASDIFYTYALSDQTITVN